MQFSIARRLDPILYEAGGGSAIFATDPTGDAARSVLISITRAIAVALVPRVRRPTKNSDDRAERPVGGRERHS